MSTTTTIDRGMPHLVADATVPGAASGRPVRLYPALAGIAGMFLGISVLLILVATVL